jgi:phage-related protein
MTTKPLVWVGSAKADLVSFPDEARREAGHDLWLVQQGASPRDWRPMPDVGAGVVEIRIHAGTEHRVFYVAKFEEAVYVLHAFDKTTRATSKGDLDTGRARYAQTVARRARER